MNIVCIGSGYIGSVTAAAFAVFGYKTIVIDVDKSKVNLINEGKSPIYEPGLEALIKLTIGDMFFATEDYEYIEQADVVFIGVGTPSAPDGSADLRCVKEAARSIGKFLNKERFTVIVDKSTVPVGTSDLVSSIIAEESGLLPEVNFAVVSNPEFLREGFALQDVLCPDRIVVGTMNNKAREIMRELYEPFITRKDYDRLVNQHFKLNIPDHLPIYFETDVKSSEMIKYASNSFLAVKISFINEIAKLCEKLGANALDVATGMGLDKRIGEKFLQVSCGWQGSCFPKDTLELYTTSAQYGSELKIVKAAIEANFDMHKYVVEKLIRKLGSLNGKNIGILGLTFKPGTDDARKTQAEYIIPEILSLGGKVRVFDPQGMKMFRETNPCLAVDYCESAEEVAHRADCIILLTHWKDFLHLNWELMAEMSHYRCILDFRNYLDKNHLEELGFDYTGIGINY